MQAPQVSLVLPIFDERENLLPLLDEIEAALTRSELTYEVIAIDDGSRDGSDAVLATRRALDPRLRVVRFGRNYGQAAAFDAGFCRARAPLIVTLDADGQNDPADIPRLVAHLQEHRLDFVSGRRRRRQDNLVWRRLPSRMANFVIRRVTRTHISDLGCSLKVYRAAVVREVRLYGEMHRFLAVLIEGAGARVGELDVNHRPRTRGASKYGLSRTFKVLLDLVTVWFMHGFATSPIYVFGFIAAGLGSGAIATSAYVLFDKLAHGVFVHRNPMFILSMVMAIMSVQFVALGVIAELLIRTYFEARGKPAYTVLEDTGAPETASSAMSAAADDDPPTLHLATFISTTGNASPARREAR